MYRKFIRIAIWLFGIVIAIKTMLRLLQANYDTFTEFEFIAIGLLGLILGIVILLRE